MWTWSLSNIYGVLLGMNVLFTMVPYHLWDSSRHDVIWKNHCWGFLTTPTTYLSVFLCHLFSASSCCITFAGAAVWVHAIPLSYCFFYYLLKGSQSAWVLVQSVSKLPRLPSRFLTSSPPWDRAFYVFPPESGCQVSSVTRDYCLLSDFCL